MPASASARPQLVDRAVDVALAALAARVEQAGEVAEGVGLEHLERQVLELPLDLPDPEPLRERRVDLHRLAGDPLLLLGGQCAKGPHVVEAVGELDQDDPDVVRHRQEHLPDVLGLLLLVAVGAELRQLGDAVHEVGDLGAEAVLDVGEAVLGVLGDVVQQRGGDGDRIEAEIGEDLRRRDGVRDVGFAGRADLGRVGIDGEVERTLHGVEVGLRVLAPQLGKQGGPQSVEIPGLGGNLRAGRIAPARATTPIRGRARRRRDGHLGIADDGFSHARSLPPPPARARAPDARRGSPQQVHRKLAGELEVARGADRDVGQPERDVDTAA